MIKTLLARGAAVLALSLVSGQALAQQRQANADPDTAALAATASARDASTASAGSERKARRDAKHGNVVTKTLGGVPGLVGGTVGPAVGHGASLIGGTVGGALGVDRKPRPEETPSRP